MFDFASLLLPLIVVAILFMWFRRNVIGPQTPNTYDGTVIVVEINHQFRLGKHLNRVYGFSKQQNTGRLVANVFLGNVISQNGNHAKIALQGKWDVVDENTIRGEVGLANRFEWIFKIGEEFPVSQNDRTFSGGSGHYQSMRATTPYCKVVELIIPGASPIDSINQ